MCEISESMCHISRIVNLKAKTLHCVWRSGWVTSSLGGGGGGVVPRRRRCEHRWHHELEKLRRLGLNGIWCASLLQRHLRAGKRERLLCMLRSDHALVLYVLAQNPRIYLRSPRARRVIDGYDYCARGSVAPLFRIRVSNLRLSRWKRRVFSVVDDHNCEI